MVRYCDRRRVKYCSVFVATVSQKEIGRVATFLEIFLLSLFLLILLTNKETLNKFFLLIILVINKLAEGLYPSKFNR
jgi:hypothetical protein